MPQSQPFELTTPRGRTLPGVVELPDAPGERPTVVICHGFKGFFEWGFFPYLSALLAERGFTAVRFNFAGSGMRPGDDLVTDPEAFRTATLSGDRDDLLAILDATGTELAPGRIDRSRLGVLGHSRGGGAALLAAADSDAPVSALVTWAAVSTFNRLDDDQNRAWRESGSIPVVNARTGQELVVGSEVLADIEANAERLDLLAAAGRRTAPWLILHGDEDETVPVAEAERLAAAASAPAELDVIEGGGHTFGAVHPFAGPTPHLIRALNATQTWLRRYLCP